MSDNEFLDYGDMANAYMADRITELEAENKRYRKALESIKALPSLEKDRARLEWMARDPDTSVQKLESGKYSVHWWANRWKETNAHDNWRDAIDEAMTKQGESNAG